MSECTYGGTFCSQHGHSGKIIFSFIQYLVIYELENGAIAVFRLTVKISRKSKGDVELKSIVGVQS